MWRIWGGSVDHHLDGSNGGEEKGFDMYRNANEAVWGGRRNRGRGGGKELMHDGMDANAGLERGQRRCRRGGRRQKKREMGGRRSKTRRKFNESPCKARSREASME